MQMDQTTKLVNKQRKLLDLIEPKLKKAKIYNLFWEIITIDRTLTSLTLKDPN